MSTDPRLLVPLLALPRFDASGLPLTRAALDRTETCIYDEGSDTLEGGLRGKVFMIGVDRPSARWYDRDDYALSFEDPSTRDRAARWLATRKGYRVGSTAPFWGRALMYPFSGQWILGFPSYLQTLPEGHGLDPGDLTTLEDGSLLVDALALALLCQHVGGTR